MEQGQESACFLLVLRWRVVHRRLHVRCLQLVSNELLPQSVFTRIAFVMVLLQIENGVLVRETSNLSIVLYFFGKFWLSYKFILVIADEPFLGFFMNTR